jgi:hypothetical protein
MAAMVVVAAERGREKEAAAAMVRNLFVVWGPFFRLPSFRLPEEMAWPLRRAEWCHA